MTCGIGVKPSNDSSARTSIIGTYFLSALEAPAPMPLPSLVRPTLTYRTEYLPERFMRKIGMVSQVGDKPLGVLTNLVGATYNLRLHIVATMTVPLRLLTNLVSTTVSTRTTGNTPSVVGRGSSKLFSVDIKLFNHARSGNRFACVWCIRVVWGLHTLTLDTSMGCLPQIGDRVGRSEQMRSPYYGTKPRVVNPIITGESDDTTTGLFQDVLKLTQLRLWSACDRENHRTVYPPLSPVVMTIPTQTFAGA
jgi:hypothetical protein